ncbi:MAG: hypothetical protein GXP55_03560, partial [Deltaproteobacteria bacterium]|nr:hypothetical protein [Deltaproteobacteria bacterium]
MSEGDDKQDDKSGADEGSGARAPETKPGPVRKKTLVGMAPVGAASDSAPKKKGTLIGMTAVSDAEVEADKKKGTLIGMTAVSDAEVEADKEA